MKIVVLDGHTLNPGDLSWNGLNELGTLTVFDRSPLNEILKNSQGANILLTNKTKVPAEVIRQLPDLKYIGLLATGYDNVDIQAAAERKIPVTNVPAYSSRSVAQLTFALILELTHQVGKRALEVREGAWIRSKDFCFGHEGLTELYGKTLGLIGLGQIGQAVAEIGLAFGMKVTAVVRHPEKYKINGIRFTDTPACFREADIISLHCPLTEMTREMVNKDLLSLMRPDAFLINTSRGLLVNEADLAEALNHHRIAGAALDVLSEEPPLASNPLLNAKNCLITPHIAWATREARLRLMHEITANVKAFFDGNPRNVVNGVC